jgi:hypothetical protein
MSIFGDDANPTGKAKFPAADEDSRSSSADSLYDGPKSPNSAARGAKTAGTRGRKARRSLKQPARSQSPPSSSRSPVSSVESPSTSTSRPNTFRGNKKSWLRYTAAERGLAASLDQIRAGDLSIHLYNAHALKRRLRSQQNIDESEPWQSKDRWIDDRGGQEFFPRRRWTAWPLEPQDVPRKGERFGALLDDDEEDLRIKSKLNDVAVSEELMEALVALVLKNAKERLRQRTEEHNSDIKVEEAVDVDVPSSIEATTEKIETSSDVDALSEDSTQSSQDDTESGELRVMEDDDMAQSLLKPTLQSLLAKLDALLIGLHHSRQNHVTSTAHKGAGDSGADIISHVPNKKSKGKSTAKSVAKRGRPLKYTHRRPGESYYDMHKRLRRHVEEADSEESASASGAEGLYTPQPGLRDWSDLLGTAALVGWDPVVVQRAARRCAAIFDENMTLLTLREENPLETVPMDILREGHDLRSGSLQNIKDSGNIRGIANVGESGKAPTDRPRKRRRLIEAMEEDIAK